MLERWQVLRCDPDTIARPDELVDKWSTAPVFEAPATVATVQQGNPDDYDWWCRTTLAVEQPTSIDFEGLTFPATVFLDGVPVAECESMFLPTRIDCDAGNHEVTIRFGSMNQWLRTRRPRGRWRSALVGTPGLRWARSTLIGRAPVYGKLPAPVGIWRPVTAVPTRIHTEATTRVEGNVVTVRGATNAASIRLTLRDPSGRDIADETTPSADGVFRFDVTVAEPLLWWPNGYGPQHLYRVVVEADGVQVADEPVGFRTISVSDERFRIRVNDTPIFCRGVTWSPPDPVRMYADGAQISDQIAAFAASGATMVRVVGGLAYEQDEFWQACAEAGLLVWQDTMLATFDPPAEHGALIARELIAVLQRVSGNPALAVVSGGSETLQQPEMMGLSHEESAMAVIDSLLPAAVALHADAHYVRSTPAPPPGSTDLAIRPDTGTAHWFGVGGYLQPIAAVRSAGVQFAAESLAFSNPPMLDYIERHFGSAAVAGHHPEWKAGVPRDRGSSWDFEDVRDFYAQAVFGEDLLAVRRTDPDRYLQLGRLAVATAMRECFAFWRRADSGCSGALVLSGRDLTPGAGWGLLDSDGHAKPALSVLGRVWAPVAVLLSDEGLAGIRVDIHNDTDAALHGELTLTATSSAGVTIDVTRSIAVPAASSITFADAELSGRFRDLSHGFKFGPPTADAVQVTAAFDGGPTLHDVLITNPASRQLASSVTATASRQTDDGWVLELMSEVAVRYIDIDIPGWRAGDNYFDLAPRLPRRIPLLRHDGNETPIGTVGSIDLRARAPIRSLT
ncbi:glycosyl hydrolase 2 galactose-binding domain-containing protein [Mycobacterium sp. PDNC021]|uniref:glycosyl hydrolase 2 galactose-binding domain-containing protein n=1 Tax=Mycobacterium sp. PDNC021 TaxID=3391399 RepID=UPI003AAD165A